MMACPRTAGCQPDQSPPLWPNYSPSATLTLQSHWPLTHVHSPLHLHRCQVGRDTFIDHRVSEPTTPFMTRRRPAMHSAGIPGPTQPGPGSADLLLAFVAAGAALSAGAVVAAFAAILALRAVNHGVGMESCGRGAGVDVTISDTGLWSPNPQTLVVPCGDQVSCISRSDYGVPGIVAQLFMPWDPPGKCSTSRGYCLECTAPDSPPASPSPRTGKLRSVVCHSMARGSSASPITPGLNQVDIMGSLDLLCRPEGGRSRPALVWAVMLLLVRLLDELLTRTVAWGPG